MPTKYTTEILAPTLQLYDSGLSALEIARRTGIDYNAVGTFLREMRGPLRRAGHYKWKMSPEIEPQVIADVQAIRNVAEVARRWKVAPRCIFDVLKRNKVQVELLGSKVVNRRYEFDETTFERCDTPEKAWAIGLLITDGSITRTHKLCLTLHERDADAVEQLRAVLKSSHPIGRYQYTHQGSTNKTPRAQFTVTSEALTDSLVQYGLIPNKTWTVRFGTGIPEHLLPHYLRGVSDGDGCFSINRGVHRWSLTGNEEFVAGCREYLADAVGLSRTTKYHRRRPEGGAVALHYGGNRSMARLARHMYDEATVCLARKREKVLPLLAHDKEPISYLCQ